MKWVALTYTLCPKVTPAKYQCQKTVTLFLYNIKMLHYGEGAVLYIHLFLISLPTAFTKEITVL